MPELPICHPYEIALHSFANLQTEITNTLPAFVTVVKFDPGGVACDFHYDSRVIEKLAVVNNTGSGFNFGAHFESKA
jgi:hypothetical protein